MALIQFLIKIFNFVEEQIIEEMCRKTVWKLLYKNIMRKHYVEILYGKAAWNKMLSENGQFPS